MSVQSTLISVVSVIMLVIVIITVIVVGLRYFLMQRSVTVRVDTVLTFLLWLVLKLLNLSMSWTDRPTVVFT